LLVFWAGSDVNISAYARIKERSNCKHAKCISCDGNSNCLGCKDNLLMKEQLCVRNCGKAYYEKKSKCHTCSEDCKKCRNKNRCERCKLPKVVMGGSCETDCAKGYFEKDGICRRRIPLKNLIGEIKLNFDRKRLEDYNFKVV